MEANERKIQNPLPLIPKLEKPLCDTSHILREEFQDTLSKNAFPYAIAENLITNITQNKCLKQCGIEVVNTRESLREAEKGITNAEICVMETQAEYLATRHLKEIMKNTTCKIYPPIDPNIVEQYYLLEADTLLPRIYERILNNSLPPYSFTFKDFCLPEHDYPSVCCLNTQETNLTNIQKKKLKHLKRIDEKFNDVKIIDFPSARSKYFDKIVFRVYPKRIIFRNFTINMIYEKTLYLKNISTNLQQIYVPLLSPSSPFYINPNSEDTKVAPGMSFSFTVGFRAKLIENSYEHVVIKVCGSQPIQIEIKSYKDMPFLRGLVYHSEFMEGNMVTDKAKNTVYNYTVDCGTVLYGYSAECYFILQNTGGDARFFIMTEEDWTNREVKNLTDSYKLILQNFKISPVYFYLEKNEICEIKFEFCPTEEGLAVDKLFLISDNNNIEEIDILGDSILYEPDFFKFVMPECPFAPSKEQDEINLLHMGAIYTCQTVVAYFYAYNRSLISIPYEFRVENLEEEESYFRVKKEWVEIRPEHGTFFPLASERIEVRVKMEGKCYGLYKFYIDMYAVDIPEASLSEGPIFTFKEEYRSKDLSQKLLTILTGRIDVQIHHIKLAVNIYPETIHFPNILYKTLTTMSDIQVENKGFCCLYFNWIQKERNNKKVRIIMKPDEFKIDSGKSVHCTLIIKLKTYDDVDETLTLNINNGFFEKHVKVTAKVQKPRMRISKSFVNFGIVKTYADISSLIKVKNLSEACLCWEVKEYQYDYVVHHFVETNNACLSQNKGELCQTDHETVIEYKLDTSVPKKFFALLVFFTVYKYERYESSHVILLGYIHEPKVRITTANGDEDIFKIEDIYYINESATKTFVLYNDSLVDAVYFWGTPNGFHSKHLKFTFDQNKGVIYPKSKKYVTMTMWFTKPGIVFDYYIPCSIECLSEPAVLQILCVIKGPQVLIFIPGIQDVIEVVWPPDFEEVSIMSVEGDLQDVQRSLIPSSSTFLDICSKTITESTTTETQSIGFYKWNLDNIFDYLRDMEHVGELPSAKENIEESKLVDADTEKSEVALYSKFASETSICEYIVYFNNVKCKEVCRKTVEIRNPMTVPLKYSISVKHFKAKNDKSKRLEKIYIDLNWKEDDSYSKQLSEHGIVVMVEPVSGILFSSSVTVTISVYAETWGYYLEEISVEIDQIPTFYMNIVIEVLGQPIEIPMFQNKNKENSIIFTNVQACTKEQRRKINFYNNSNIPCLIIWHVFAKTEDTNQDPFNVLFDICGFEDQPNFIGNVKIIKYVGEEMRHHFQIFNVEPKEFYIKPKQTRQLTVIFDPSLYLQCKVNIPSICGQIVGSIYVENKYCYRNFLLRNPIKNLKLIKIAIETSISVASLNMQCIRGDTDIQMNINNILNDNLQKKNMRLVFRNDCNADIIINMNVIEPFEVISMRSQIGGMEVSKSYKIQAPVMSSGYLEVIIKCEILNDYLMNISDVLYRKVQHYLKGVEILSINSVKITRLLKVTHQCKVIQELPISVTLYFPFIEVSTKNLNFDEVCVNSRKHLTFKLLNKTASSTWYDITFSTPGEIYVCDQPTGYLEPYKISERSKYLTITFTPKINDAYVNIMRISTKIPQYYIDVTITGIGTFDEKYMYEEKFDKNCFKF